MNDHSYWSLGGKLAKAWDIGKGFGNEKRSVQKYHYTLGLNTAEMGIIVY